MDIYWDLHLGVKGEAIPKQVRQTGEAFNTVLAYRNPLLPIVYEKYMTVRNRLDFLKQWIDKRVEDITIGRTPNPEKTMAWYWIKNAGDSKHFSKKAMVFECFHNFVAFSQWGNTIFGVMSRLSENGVDTQVRDALAYFWGSVEGGAGTNSSIPAPALVPGYKQLTQLFRLLSLVFIT